MSTNRTITCYDYVSQPFRLVQEALRKDAARIFARATTGAGERERALNVQLRVRIGMVDVGTDVKVEVGTIETTTSSPYGYSVMVIPLTWKSATNPSLFPDMQAKLFVYPLSNHETQIEFEGDRSRERFDQCFQAQASCFGGESFGERCGKPEGGEIARES